MQVPEESCRQLFLTGTRRFHSCEREGLMQEARRITTGGGISGGCVVNAHHFSRFLESVPAQVGTVAIEPTEQFTSSVMLNDFNHAAMKWCAL